MTPSADTPLMACGHAANGTRRVGDESVPCCVICGITGADGSEQIVDAPDLTGRLSVCSYYRGDPTDRAGKCPPTRHGGGNYPSVAESSVSLPFFEHRPNDAADRHYCGCWGWD